MADANKKLCVYILGLKFAGKMVLCWALVYHFLPRTLKEKLALRKKARAEAG